MRHLRLRTFLILIMGLVPACSGTDYGSNENDIGGEGKIPVQVNLSTLSTDSIDPDTKVTGCVLYVGFGKHLSSQTLQPFFLGDPDPNDIYQYFTYPVVPQNYEIRDGEQQELFATSAPAGTYDRVVLVVDHACGAYSMIVENTAFGKVSTTNRIRLCFNGAFTLGSSAATVELNGHVFFPHWAKAQTEEDIPPVEAGTLISL